MAEQREADGRRAELAAVALRIVDAEGIGGLTMRKLAAQAGISAMTPYYYFADKAAVIDAIAMLIDAEIGGEAVVGTESASWSVAEWIEELTSRAVRVLLRHHPDLTLLMQARASGSSEEGLTEQALANFDEFVRRLAAFGITGVAAARLSFLMAQGVFMLAHACRTDAAGVDVDTRLRLQWRAFREASDGRYPGIDSVVAASDGNDDGSLLQAGVAMLGNSVRYLQLTAHSSASSPE